MPKMKWCENALTLLLSLLSTEAHDTPNWDCGGTYFIYILHARMAGWAGSSYSVSYHRISYRMQLGTNTKRKSRTCNSKSVDQFSRSDAFRVDTWYAISSQLQLGNCAHYGNANDSSRPLVVVGDSGKEKEKKRRSKAKQTMHGQ